MGVAIRLGPDFSDSTAPCEEKQRKHPPPTQQQQHSNTATLHNNDATHFLREAGVPTLQLAPGLFPVRDRAPRQAAGTADPPGFG